MMNIRRIGILLAAGLFLCGCGETIEGAEASNASEADALPVFAVTELTDVTDSETVAEDNLTAEEAAALPAGTSVDGQRIVTDAIDDYFTAEPISDEVFARIDGVSYKENPNIGRDALRYLRVLHYQPDGGQAIGEMIVNQLIAEDVLAIFRQLYEIQYPIERMVLVDEYGGDDEASMADNNTSAFNYRVVAGTSVLSRHALGMAIDLNPCMNPYVTYNADGSENISPANAAEFADRTAGFQMMIDTDDAAYQLFTAYGFEWGGSWTTVKDYQHFEKN